MSPVHPRALTPPSRDRGEEGWHHNRLPGAGACGHCWGKLLPRGQLQNQWKEVTWLDSFNTQQRSGSPWQTLSPLLFSRTHKWNRSGLLPGKEKWVFASFECPLQNLNNTN